MRISDWSSDVCSSDLSYQLGLFGEVGRGVAASRAQYEGAGYDYATVLISTEAEIARNYVLARAYQAPLANSRRSLAIQADNLAFPGFLVPAGLVSSLDPEPAPPATAPASPSLGRGT